MKVVWLVFILIVIGFHFATAQEHSVGLRLGEPLAISYKLRIGMMGYEVIAGRYGVPGSPSYFREVFKDKDVFEGRYYLDHTPTSAFALHGRWLNHVSIPVQTTRNFDWYWGFGGQLLISQIEYFYTNDPEATNGFNPDGNEKVTHFSLSPEVIIGLEYKFEKVPVSIFTDMAVAIEVFQKPFTPRLPVGMGIRYFF